jgi:hypothetical protein
MAEVKLHGNFVVFDHVIGRVADQEIEFAQCNAVAADRLVLEHNLPAQEVLHQAFVQALEIVPKPSRRWFREYLRAKFGRTVPYLQALFSIIRQVSFRGKTHGRTDKLGSMTHPRQVAHGWNSVLEMGCGFRASVHSGRIP